ELNNTDGDLGIHALIDGDAWKKLEIEDPNGRRLLKIKAKGRLKKQGLTELFFESAEPVFEELDPVDFFKRFPEGIYEIEGETLEGEELESEVFVSHVMPAPADGVMVNDEEAAEDCDADPLPSVSEPVVISWDPVTESHPELGAEGDVEVVHYEIVIEQEDLELEMKIKLPGDATSFEIPPEFLALGEEFKFEILVRAETGNQTAVETCFELE
ncbi:MAG: hypothetical protein O7G30_10000, partial [Proteobacteria bacterium]|nr:hypothetical protein [Pseudomonadota bacterium]